MNKKKKDILTGLLPMLFCIHVDLLKLLVSKQCLGLCPNWLLSKNNKELYLNDYGKI